MKTQDSINLKEKIRDIPDFPMKGILFRDITTLLTDAKAFSYVIDTFYDYLKDKEFDYIVPVEARGYIFGSALAYKLKKGLVLVRKPGKLPGTTKSKSYDLEYGKNTLEIHADQIKKGDRVVVIDDLIATGGSCYAVKELIEDLGGKIVSFAFLIELTDLKGRDKLKGYDVFSIVKY